MIWNVRRTTKYCKGLDIVFNQQLLIRATTVLHLGYGVLYQDLSSDVVVSRGCISGKNDLEKVKNRDPANKNCITAQT